MKHSLLLGPKTSSEVELMETYGVRTQQIRACQPKTSSEVELMETRCNKFVSKQTNHPKNSSEVELMETCHQRECHRQDHLKLLRKLN